MSSRLPEITLDFGKHKGMPLTLDAIPLEYIIWLAGYRRPVEGHVETHIDSAVDSIWMNEEFFRGMYCCIGKWHAPTCCGFCLGRTREETRRNLLQSIENGKAQFNEARHLRVWLGVRGDHPEVVQRAKHLLLGICWKCGGRLVPIGTARANGRLHDDWGDRKFHKSCWKTLQGD